MKKYKIQIDIEALQNIQDATDWYNLQRHGLGGRFQKQVKAQINGLTKNAFAFGVRYSTVRSMLIKKFPFLVHFTIEQTANTVKIFAVLHTSRNPEIWKKRNPN